MILCCCKYVRKVIRIQKNIKDGIKAAYDTRHPQLSENNDRSGSYGKPSFVKKMLYMERVSV